VAAPAWGDQQAAELDIGVDDDVKLCRADRARNPERLRVRLLSCDVGDGLFEPTR